MPIGAFGDLVNALRPRLSRLGVPPDVRTAIALRYFGGRSYIDIGAALGVHSATIYRALWQVIDAVNSSTRRYSNDSAPTTRSCCHKLAGLGAAAPPGGALKRLERPCWIRWECGTATIGVVVWLGGRCGERCDGSVPDAGGCWIVRPDTRTDASTDFLKYSVHQMRTESDLYGVI